MVVLAARIIPEKNAPALVPAVALAREQLPDLRGVIYDDGPDRSAVLRAIEELGLVGQVSAPGFVDVEALADAISTALCLVLPSSREAYGRVVIESSARGVPVVFVADLRQRRDRAGRGGGQRHGRREHRTGRARTRDRSRA